MNDEPERIDGGDDEAKADQVGHDLGAVDAEPERCEQAAETAARPNVLVDKRQQPGGDEDRERQRQSGQKAGEEDAPDSLISFLRRSAGNPAATRRSVCNVSGGVKGWAAAGALTAPAGRFCGGGRGGPFFSCSVGTSMVRTGRGAGGAPFTGSEACGPISSSVGLCGPRTSRRTRRPWRADRCSAARAGIGGRCRGPCRRATAF